MFACVLGGCADGYGNLIGDGLNDRHIFLREAVGFERLHIQRADDLTVLS